MKRRAGANSSMRRALVRLILAARSIHRTSAAGSSTRNLPERKTRSERHWWESRDDSLLRIQRLWPDGEIGVPTPLLPIGTADPKRAGRNSRFSGPEFVSPRHWRALRSLEAAARLRRFHARPRAGSQAPNVASAAAS